MTNETRPTTLNRHTPLTRAAAWIESRFARRHFSTEIDTTTVVPFVIMCVPRSGSTHLVDLLNLHRQVCVHNEVFHDDYATRARVHHRRARDDQDGAAFLHELYTGRRFRKRTAVGLKLHCNQVLTGPLSSAWDYIRDNREIVVIDLMRDNLLEAMVSHRIAERTGEWHVRRASGGTFKGQVTLSTFDCLSYFERIETLRARALACAEGHPVISVEYEDLRHNEQSTLDRIVDALGLPQFAAFPIHFKVETLSMRERIQNYDQLRESLASTPYARFFSDRT